ncbi:hypothetical protein BWO90_11020 (plasmid) [Sinorhizobium meliloti]|nr:hypothetical protein BWO90_11020 [Sinorhizobium meliloti]
MQHSLSSGVKRRLRPRVLSAARWMMALLLLLISVLVTEIQQRRVCGAGKVLSAQGLGLAGSL